MPFCLAVFCVEPQAKTDEKFSGLGNHARILNMCRASCLFFFYFENKVLRRLRQLETVQTKRLYFTSGRIAFHSTREY